jgi:hypothetical protein
MPLQICASICRIRTALAAHMSAKVTMFVVSRHQSDSLLLLLLCYRNAFSQGLSGCEVLLAAAVPARSGV